MDFTPMVLTPFETVVSTFVAKGRPRLERFSVTHQSTDHLSFMDEHCGDITRTMTLSKQNPFRIKIFRTTCETFELVETLCWTTIRSLEKTLIDGVGLDLDVWELLLWSTGRPSQGEWSYNSYRRWYSHNCYRFLIIRESSQSVQDSCNSPIRVD